MVQKVHDEALDVGAVVVLIRHDHQVPIAQLLCAVVYLHTLHILLLPTTTLVSGAAAA